MKRRDPATHSPSGADTNWHFWSFKTPQFGIQLPGQLNAKLRQFEAPNDWFARRHQRVNETPKSGNSFTFWCQHQPALLDLQNATVRHPIARATKRQSAEI